MNSDSVVLLHEGKSLHFDLLKWLELRKRNPEVDISFGIGISFLLLRGVAPDHWRGDHDQGLISVWGCRLFGILQSVDHLLGLLNICSELRNIENDEV